MGVRGKGDPNAHCKALIDNPFPHRKTCRNALVEARSDWFRVSIDVSILLCSYGYEIAGSGIVAGSEVAVSRGREEFGRAAIHIFGSLYGEFAVYRSAFW
jgi:hypothetical protein